MIRGARAGHCGTAPWGREGGVRNAACAFARALAGEGRRLVVGAAPYAAAGALRSTAGMSMVGAGSAAGAAGAVTSAC